MLSYPTGLNIQKPGWSNFERFGNLGKYDNCRIADAALNAADICPMDRAFKGKPFLGKSEILPKSSHI